MKPIKCKECGVEVEQKPTGRPKNFCSVSCRSNFWQKQKRKEAELYRFLATALPANKSEDSMYDLIEQGVAVTKVTPTKAERIDPQSENAQILKQIATIRAEPCPPHRNTVLGRKTWIADQQKRIIDLESKLK